MGEAMIERKYEKQITWILKFTEEQDSWFRFHIEEGTKEPMYDRQQKQLFRQILACFPKEGKEDEKVTDSFDGSNRINAAGATGPGPTVPVGPAPASADPGGAGTASTGVPGNPAKTATEPTWPIGGTVIDDAVKDVPTPREPTDAAGQENPVSIKLPGMYAPALSATNRPASPGVVFDSR